MSRGNSREGGGTYRSPRSSAVWPTRRCVALVRDLTLRESEGGSESTLWSYMARRELKSLLTGGRARNPAITRYDTAPTPSTTAQVCGVNTRPGPRARCEREAGSDGLNPGTREPGISSCHGRRRAATRAHGGARGRAGARGLAVEVQVIILDLGPVGAGEGQQPCPQDGPGQPHAEAPHDHGDAPDEGVVARRPLRASAEERGHDVFWPAAPYTRASGSAVTRSVVSPRWGRGRYAL
jgi:hypothetical protein